MENRAETGGTCVVAERNERAAASLSVYVVDDHSVVRDGVRAQLEAAGVTVAGEAETVRGGLEGVLRTQPSVALVDVRLPDGSGIELIREIQSRLPSTRCVVFTSLADDDAFFQSVMAGSVGYLLKHVSRDELVDALCKAARGETLIKAETIDELRQRAIESPSAAVDPLADLTGQERRIVGMVADGMRNREIAERLGISDKTVRNYVTIILSKLGKKSRTELAVHVLRLAQSSRV